MSWVRFAKRGKKQGINGGKQGRKDDFLTETNLKRSQKETGILLRQGYGGQGRDALVTAHATPDAENRRTAWRFAALTHPPSV